VCEASNDPSVCTSPAFTTLTWEAVKYSSLSSSTRSIKAHEKGSAVFNRRARVSVTRSFMTARATGRRVREGSMWRSTATMARVQRPLAKGEPKPSMVQPPGWDRKGGAVGVDDACEVVW
jgi:hypothetical protein